MILISKNLRYFLYKNVSKSWMFVIWLLQYINNQLCALSYMNSEIRQFSCWTCKWQNIYLQEWVVQDGILMDHSSQYLLLTPFITWFVYHWKVTLCLHLLMKLSTICHLRRETSGKDCGWWVIDELDQFILWYIYILLHKVRWLSKIGILYFLCVFRVFESLQIFLKPRRKAQKIRFQ